MAYLQGISKLPISLKSEDAIEIFMELANVSGKIGRLDEKFKRSILKSDFINTLALKESVQSTRIEGTQVTFTDMIEQTHKKDSKWEYIEVNNYQKALISGTEQILNGYPVTTRLILDLHRMLMNNARGTNEAKGQFRRIQNFIGPTNRIEDAVYIPIPANEIDDYMKNWEYYANKHPYDEKLDISHLNSKDIILDENSHPLLKVAILHAQFESIHPFLDGNGRLGRILIALYMVKSGLISSPIFFVSEELEKQRSRYYHLLNGVRGQSPDWNSWLKFFLKACDRMADKLSDLLDSAEALAVRGFAACPREIVKRVYLFTFREPNTTVTQVAKQFGIASSTARGVLNELVELELLFKDTSQKRNVEYYNYDVLDLLN